MNVPPDTRVRILQVALDEFLSHGIKKTSMDEVAARAGLTRVTIYRYFSDKRSLARAAFLQIVELLEAVCQEIESDPPSDPETVLDQIAVGLGKLSRGDLPAGLSELELLYPEVAAEFHTARVAAIRRIFERLLEQARRQGRLRAELNPLIVQTYFLTSVVNVLAHPDLVAAGLSSAEIFATVKSIFLHGILKE